MARYPGRCGINPGNAPALPLHFSHDQGEVERQCIYTSDSSEVMVKSDVVLGALRKVGAKYKNATRTDAAEWLRAQGFTQLTKRVNGLPTCVWVKDTVAIANCTITLDALRASWASREDRHNDKEVQALHKLVLRAQAATIKRDEIGARIERQTAQSTYAIESAYRRACDIAERDTREEQAKIRKQFEIWREVEELIEEPVPVIREVVEGSASALGDKYVTPVRYRCRAIKHKVLCDLTANMDQERYELLDHANRNCKQICDAARAHADEQFRLLNNLNRPILSRASFALNSAISEVYYFTIENPEAAELYAQRFAPMVQELNRMLTEARTLGTQANTMSTLDDNRVIMIEEDSL